MEEKFTSIGSRILQERTRLGISQPAFGSIAGTTKWTVQNWEKGESSPNAANLAALADKGLDVLFVVTGVRLGSMGYQSGVSDRAFSGVAELSRTDREEGLLALFRKLSEADRLIAEQMIGALANADRKAK